MLEGYRRGAGEISVSRAVPGSCTAVQIAARIAGCPRMSSRPGCLDQTSGGHSSLPWRSLT
jgi:hypothetical protein